MSEIFALPSLEGELSGKSIIEGELSTDVTYQPYAGEYLVEPLFGSDLSLNTENRVLKDDLTVKQIPYFETPTVNGGTTVYIGVKEV